MKGRKTGGRKKGTPNKLTVAAREAMQLAFDGVGGVDGLIQWAKENSTEFYKIYARLIPLEVEHGGNPNGDAIKVDVTWHVADKPGS